ncbi:MAG: metallophosphoesterase family protein [Anaerolineae bacterium]|nr:metallophosphoesterase family protein [Anaerolineae bacterium]
MPENRKQTFEQLDRLLHDDDLVVRLPLDDAARYAILSDLHLGNGGGADNFAHNQDALQHALAHYRESAYTLILVGDIEELWQFDLPEIYARYDRTVYRALRSFAPGMVHRVYGNHDMEWAGLSDPAVPAGGTHRWATAGIRLGDRVLIAHGHQGDLFADRRTWASRFAVRIFRYVEPVARWLGWGDKADTLSRVPKGREQTYYEWAKGAGVILICGHTHRAFFASRSRYDRLQEEYAQLSAAFSADPQAAAQEQKRVARELAHERRRGRDIGPLEDEGQPVPCYFNCGCGCYSNGLTMLEIEADTIRLVKWHNDASLPPEQRREVLQQDRLDAFIQATAP